MVTPAQSKIKAWRENPAQFVHETLGVQEIDPWQKQVLEAFPCMDPDKLRISMQACAGPGKSAVLAWCGWNFLSCYGSRGEHPKGAAVSITGDNLADNLWPEFSKWQSRSEFLLSAFKWTKSRIFSVSHPETWFMSARSFSKTADTEEQGRTLSGLHSKFVLALVDESGDIPLAVAKAAEQALSTSPIFGKILQAGNPTSRDGMLYAAASTFRHLWYIVRITGDPEDPNRSQRIGIEWAREQIRAYGRNDPWVKALILGEFPEGAINSLLSPEEVEAAMGRHLPEDAYAFAQKRLGVDVARFGDDRSVIFPRQGLAAFQPIEMRGVRSNVVGDRVIKAKIDWDSELEFVDGTGGYGAGVIDHLIQAKYAPIEVNFSGQAIDPRFANKRAEMWWNMAEWVKRGGALPHLSQLSRELTTPTYSYREGKILIEPKERIKERLGFSPDLADGLGLTFAHPDMPGKIRLPGGFSVGRNDTKVDYDPYDPKRW